MKVFFVIRKFYPAFLMVMFFGPYFGGTSLRLDQLMVWFGLFYAWALIFAGRIKVDRIEAIVFSLATMILILVIVRVFVDYEILINAMQMINHFSYVAGGIGIYLISRYSLRKNSNILYWSFLIISVLINLYGLMQYLSPDSLFVRIALRIYGGRGDSEYGYDDFDTIAALSVLGGQRFTSIFVGVHAYAMFNLLVLTVIWGGRAFQNAGVGIYVIRLSLVLAVIGGALSTSKTFIFGSVLLFLFYAYSLIFIEKKLLKVFMMGVASSFIVLFLAGDIRVLGDIIDLVMRGDIGLIFSSRFGGGGEEGYLDDVMYITFQPFTLAFGLGELAFRYKFSDSEFRQVLILGGGLLFVLFYGLIFYFARLNFKAAKESPFGFPFFALAMVLLVVSIGQPVHIQGRLVPIWIIFQMVFANS